MKSAMAKSDTSSKSRRLSPEARRAQLLDIAAECCAEGSLDRLGHGDIAKRAGVSTATVFNYFPTREDLLNAVLAEIERVIDDLFNTVKSNSQFAAAPPEVRFLLLAAAHRKNLEDNESLIKAYLNWTVTFNPELRPQYVAFQNRVLAQIIDIAPELFRSRQDARLVYGAANMYAMMWIDKVPEDTLAGFVQRLSDAILPTKPA